MAHRPLTTKTVTAAQINKFLTGIRSEITANEIRYGSMAETANRPLHALKHDCFVVNGARRSPHRGGKEEAKQRVVNAMNARVGHLTPTEVVQLAKHVAAVVAAKGTACVCGHAVEEHGNDPEYPGSSACQYEGDSAAPDDGCDCIVYESEG